MYHLTMLWIAIAALAYLGGRVHGRRAPATRARPEPAARRADSVAMTATIPMPFGPTGLSFDRATRTHHRTSAMKVTADTITDEQILDLHALTDAEVGRQWPNPEAMELRFATSAALSRNLDQSDGDGTWRHWRAQCAAAWNARHGGES